MASRQYTKTKQSRKLTTTENLKFPTTRRDDGVLAFSFSARSSRFNQSDAFMFFCTASQPKNVECTFLATITNSNGIFRALLAHNIQTVIRRLRLPINDSEKRSTPSPRKYQSDSFQDTSHTPHAFSPGFKSQKKYPLNRWIEYGNKLTELFRRNSIKNFRNDPSSREAITLDQTFTNRVRHYYLCDNF